MEVGAVDDDVIAIPTYFVALVGVVTKSVPSEFAEYLTCVYVAAPVSPEYLLQVYELADDGAVLDVPT